MAFINRWKISQNWEQNAKASDSAIWTFSLRTWTATLKLKTAYDLKRQSLKVPNRLSMRGQIFCQGSAIPFNLSPQKNGNKDAFKAGQ